MYTLHCRKLLPRWLIEREPLLGWHLIDSCRQQRRYKLHRVPDGQLLSCWEHGPHAVPSWHLQAHSVGRRTRGMPEVRRRLLLSRWRHQSHCMQGKYLF